MEELGRPALKGESALETDKKFLEGTRELTLARPKSPLCSWGDNSLLTQSWDKWKERIVKAVLLDSRKVVIRVP